MTRWVAIIISSSCPLVGKEREEKKSLFSFSLPSCCLPARLLQCARFVSSHYMLLGNWLVSDNFSSRDFKWFQSCRTFSFSTGVNRERAKKKTLFISFEVTFWETKIRLCHLPFYLFRVLNTLTHCGSFNRSSLRKVIYLASSLGRPSSFSPSSVVKKKRLKKKMALKLARTGS